MSSNLLGEASMFENGPIVSRHLTKEENVEVGHIFAIVRAVQENAEIREGTIVLNEPQFNDIVDAFIQAYNTFLRHFKVIQIEVMNQFLIPLMTIILSSVHYLKGEFKDVDIAFDAINERASQFPGVA